MADSKNTEDITLKKRAAPVGVVMCLDAKRQTGTVYRWNTGEEEVCWDEENKIKKITAVKES